jgi:Uma2 family endonuclease
MAIPQLVTAEELAEMGERYGNFELVRGKLVPVSFASARHGQLAAEIAAALLAFVKPRQLGVVYVETGYVVERNPDTVRGPDVSFISSDRLRLVPKRGFTAGGPDLAVEIRSRDNTMKSLVAKAQEYITSGTRTVWIVDPEQSQVMVLRPGDSHVVLGAEAILEGHDVLPGFSIPVKDIFS